MKFLLTFIVLFVTISSSSVLAQIRGYVNPSAVYCERMGYKYENRIDSSGNSNGVCILPNDSVVDAWDFFRGKVATKYSYCEKMGYKTQYTKVDKDGYISECAVCVEQLKKGGEVRIPMTELMEKNGEPLITLTQKKKCKLNLRKSKTFKFKRSRIDPQRF